MDKKQRRATVAWRHARDGGDKVSRCEGLGQHLHRAADGPSACPAHLSWSCGVAAPTGVAGGFTLVCGPAELSRSARLEHAVGGTPQQPRRQRCSDGSSVWWCVRRGRAESFAGAEERGEEVPRCVCRWCRAWGQLLEHGQGHRGVLGNEVPFLWRHGRAHHGLNSHHDGLLAQSTSKQHS